MAEIKHVFLSKEGSIRKVEETNVRKINNLKSEGFVEVILDGGKVITKETSTTKEYKKLAKENADALSKVEELNITIETMKVETAKVETVNVDLVKANKDLVAENEQLKKDLVKANK